MHRSLFDAYQQPKRNFEKGNPKKATMLWPFLGSLAEMNAPAVCMPIRDTP
jgi:hypothetical protein